MNCKIEKSTVSGKIRCPSNKSYSHRAIFLASLVGGNSKVENVLLADDIKATIVACKSLGASIIQEGTTIIVKDPIGTGKFVPEINTQNSGTTIRIASAIASLFPNETILTGDASLQKRPMQPLLDALTDLGARCSSNNGTPPVKISGKVTGGSVTISGTISSQFISALLIISPLTERGIEINIEGNLVSKPYLDATIMSMRKFGIAVQTLIPYKHYNILPQPYKPTIFTVPIDFSSLALLLAQSVLNGNNLVIQGDIDELPQGDEVFIDILEQLGVDVTINEDNIATRSPEKLKGGKFDLSNSPDLLPPLSILALKASSPIEIVNVKHARLKETDRISILARELQKIGIKVTENDDGLKLEPPEKITSATLVAENDHRLFMAFCIAGTYIGNCTVTDPASVSVSYPGFVEEMNRIGSRISVN